MASRVKPSPYPGLYLPGFGPLYDSVAEYIYPFVRVVTGLMLLPHGIPKLMAGPEAVAASLAKRGLEPAFAFALSITALETVGAICIIIGLYTRPIALLLVLEFLVIIFVAHWPAGWFAGGGGIELPVLWGCLLLAILLRGGGPHSVDRAMGKEF